jgi:indolepyruvate ferredoxin oxidoreductase
MRRRSGRPPAWERYVRAKGRLHLTGLQALVRLTLEQVRRDRAEGRRVGVVVSGYPGSPLAGFDQALRAVEPLLHENDVRLIPGINEELAASTVGGTQLLELFPHSQYDGVVGMWYGKAPGLDRSLDAIRHCNFTGTSRHGGVLAVVGDDPGCKSSSLPSHSHHAFAHAFVPLLAPANAEEVLNLGLHGIALSRYSGLWVGLRVVADVADGGGIFEVGERTLPQLPKLELGGRPFRPRIDPLLLPPNVNRIEEEIVLGRLEAVREYALANDLDTIESHKRDRLGIVAAGWLWTELVEALERLGIDASARASLGLRLLKVGLVYPLSSRTVEKFGGGLEQVVVIDERRGFLEEQVRGALSGGIEQPFVVGQRTERGEPWLAALPDLGADRLAVELGTFLGRQLGRPELLERAGRLRARSSEDDVTRLVRPPHFCSGCPHSVSTRLPEGSVAGGGIGCHTMALLMDRGVRFLGAMGSEGAHWIGLAPFVDTPHIFQNLGDGTYAHSGRLAVRAAVAAGARVTFKLLYNGRVAMTGGQEIVGGKLVADLTRDLLSDGVARVIAVSDDLELRTLALSHPRVECVPARKYEASMRRLADEPGVTALVFDEFCAHEKQRLQRRGILPRPAERVMIHEDVCEGCGDCGAKSACLSLRPVPTPLGRKTRVHATSCSDDRSCIDGDCPAFLSMEGTREKGRGRETWLAGALPDPALPTWGDDPYRLLLVGIGSTGVVTTNAILMRAAEIEGRFALHLDQTGLSQRGGRVVSHALIGRRPLHGSPRVGDGLADGLLAFDPLGSTDASALRAVSTERTRAIVHGALSPTAEMVTRPELDLPDLEELIARLGRHTREVHVIESEAIAEAVFGSSLSAVVPIGYACQLGVGPVRPESLDQAIVDRDIAVEENRSALRLGRAIALDPSLARRILANETPPTVARPRSPDEATVLGDAWTEIERLIPADPPEEETLAATVAGLALDLADYQDPRYARSYLERLIPIMRAETAAGTGTLDLTATAARELYRLMAYKDEYEVARLLVRGPYRRWLESHSKGRLRVRYHLHPPLLRALGLRRKLAMGRWVEPLLRALIPLRRLRGTRLDPFGHTAVRRMERDLSVWYADLLEAVARGLRADNLGEALEIVSAPETIRGFEEIKVHRAEEARRRVDTLLARFSAA